MNRNTPPDNRPEPDDRDGRVVGKDDDNLLESIGKAIVAPVEGADEDPKDPLARPTGRSPT